MNDDSDVLSSNEVTMLPCPFCGNTRATIFEHFKDAHYFYANCIGCDAEGPPALSSKEARDAWNHRGRSSDETFAVRPVDCKHKRAKVQCPDCGIDFLGGIRTAPRDVPIWICSVCGGWNHVQDKFCTHTHAMQSPENGKAD